MQEEAVRITVCNISEGRDLAPVPAVADPIVRQICELGEKYNPANRVLLFNDDFHGMDEVVLQIQKATGYSLEKAEAIMFDAHTHGQTVVYAGELADCNRVADVLMEIRLTVVVERL